MSHRIGLRAIYRAARNRVGMYFFVRYRIDSRDGSTASAFFSGRIKNKKKRKKCALRPEGYRERIKNNRVTHIASTEKKRYSSRINNNNNTGHLIFLSSQQYYYNNRYGA